ncbi:hypothetical protein HUJ04_005772 [Dendroctonus ponderosae]
MVKVSNTLITVLVVDLLATCGDITVTWSSPMYPKLISNDSSVNPLGRPITEDEYSWIGSLINIGAIVGALPSGFVADKIGRKFTLIGLAVPHLVAYLIYAFADSIYLFYLGRFINGISEGAGYAILPMYLAEITDDSNRAALSVTLNIFWTLGNFIPFAIGPYLEVRVFNLILAGIPCVFLACFLLVGCETPHYLVQVGRDAQAADTIAHLRSCSRESAEKEVKILKGAHEDETGSLADIVKNPGLRKALLISLALIVLQQFSGIAAVDSYLEPIFQATGSDFSASVSSTICGACMFLFSFPTTFIIERAGKKWPLAISCLGDALSLLALGAFFYSKDSTSLDAASLSWLPIAGLISYIFFFNLGFAALPWTISSELFPNNVKPLSASAVAGMSWMTAFVVTKFFSSLTNAVGRAATFWMFGACCLFTVLFDVLWVPETKGKSFSEIQNMLQE